MQYRKLGNSKLEVSVLSFGAWQIGDPDYWGTDAEYSPDRVINTAIDGGINLFDTAEGYGDGESERVLGRELGDKRGNVYIASKVFPQHCSPDKLRESCEASLKRLNTDYIDLYQVHWPSRELGFADTYEVLDNLRTEGKIRNIGVSNFGPLDLAEWEEAGDAVSNQIGYNLVFRAAEYQMIPACLRYGAGILVYSPLMQGLLAGRWSSADDIPLVRRRFRHFSNERPGTRHGESGHEEMLMEIIRTIRILGEEMNCSMAVLSLAWLIRQRGISSAIIGSRNADQLKDNLKAVELEIGGEEMYILNTITGRLKSDMGMNADLWEGSSSSRIQ